MAFTYYRAITIDHLQVPGDLTNYPLTFRSAVGTVDTIGTAITWVSGDQFPVGMDAIDINGTTYTFTRINATTGTTGSSAGTQSGATYCNTPFLKTVANGGLVQNASGFDKCLFTSSALLTLLKFETERWIATTGEVILHIKVDPSSSTDLTIYLAYGDTSISSEQGDPTSVWDSNFLGVYHLPNGTTLTALDSTTNSRNGTLTNTPTAAAGKIGGAGSFVGASTQHITLGNGINPDAITISAWINHSGDYSDTRSVVIRNLASPVSFSFIRVRTTGKLYMGIRSSAGNDRTYDGSGSAMSSGVWYHVVLVYSSSVGLIGYLNGAVDGTFAANGVLQTSSANTYIAEDPVGSFSPWDGQIDEVRISNAARSANWVTTEYNNQSAPYTFYTLGAQTQVTNYNVVVSDTLNNYNAAQSFIYSYLKSLSDSSSNWLDTSSNALLDPTVSLTTTATDTLNAWGDAIDRVYGLRSQFSDSANNLLDALVNTPNISFGQFSDLFLITDELKVQLHHKLTVGSLNTLSDAILLTFRFLLENADQIVQVDSAAVGSNSLGALTLSVGEGLSMSDSLGETNNVDNPLNSTNFINYLRRYLNDVPR